MGNSTPESTAPAAGPLRSAMVGAVFAFDGVGLCLALAAICFAGPLSPGVGLGTAAFALATILSTLAIFWLGQLRLPVAIAQDTSIAILAPAVGIVGLAVQGPVEAKVATALALLGTTAALSGLVFWTVGHFRLGRFVRMFPYPVAAGFLSSSGILLILAGISVLTETMELGGIVVALQDGATLRNLVYALVLTVALGVTIRAFGGALSILAVMASYLLAFYALTGWLGIDRAQSVDMGLLPALAVDPGGGIAPSLQLFTQIEWAVILTVAPVIAAVVVMNLIGLVLNTAGVELGTRSDIDMDRELRVTGLVNIVIGGFGGIASYLQGGTTLILDKIPLAPGPTVAGHLTVMALAIGFAVPIVANVPTVFISGLLIFVGVSMLDDWLIASLRRLPGADVGIILGIVGVTIAFGILPAIAVGLLLALMGFAYGYARMPLVRQSTDARRRPSILDRPPAEQEILDNQAQNVRILHLHGALFFGSAEALIDQVKAERARADDLRGLILDVSDVSQFDSSVPAALAKLSYLLRDLEAGLHLCGLPPRLMADYIRWGLPMAGGPQDAPGIFAVWDTLDQAIEHCENRLLARHSIFQPTRDVAEVMRTLCNDDPRAGALFAAMDCLDLEEGAVLLHRDGTDEDVYVVETGRLGAYLSGPDGAPIRVRSMGAGAVVGEVAHVLKTPRTADVVAEAPSRVWRLSQSAMARIDAQDPALSALKNMALARALGLKVVQTNALLTHARTK